VERNRYIAPTKEKESDKRQQTKTKEERGRKESKKRQRNQRYTIHRQFVGNSKLQLKILWIRIGSRAEPHPPTPPHAVVAMNALLRHKGRNLRTSHLAQNVYKRCKLAKTKARQSEKSHKTFHWFYPICLCVSVIQYFVLTALSLKENSWLVGNYDVRWKFPQGNSIVWDISSGVAEKYF